MTEHDGLLARLLERRVEPMWLVDVGARWGPNPQWDRLHSKARILCFEPDTAEAARLQAEATPHVRYHAAALAAAAGERELVVTSEPACSSLLPPIEVLYRDYPPLHVMTPQSRVTVPCRVLDDVLAGEGIGQVTALKLDTQGTELEILRGAAGALAGCAFVDVEVQFNPLYEGAGLFCDVDRFLREHGMVLWRLESLVHYAPAQMESATTTLLVAADPAPFGQYPVPNGQLFWGQAHYVRAEYPRTGAASLGAETALDGAIMAGAYGYLDLAAEILRRSPHADLAGAG